ncbi:MAG: SPOR domain-containing protein [Alphaproteobacteria bacterium]|nr:SPOR domain-containing protein [Alphaproteobacteria bacterium]
MSNDQEQDLDLLDLNDEEDVDSLPEATPFSVPRPKRPWLLLGLGVAIIVLSTWIIIARVVSGSGSTVSVDLDAPVTAEVQKPAPVEDLKVPPKPVVPPKPIEKPKAAPAPAPAPAPKPEEVKPVESDGNPIRVVQDRKDVTFNPDKPAPKPAAKPQAQKPAPAPAPAKKPAATATNGSIYVQFGSYSTRALAQDAEKKIRASHQGLFAGKQFVILAAQVNGKTTYRLRIAFNSGADANGFCRNAKSDGLDCYVTK